MKKKCILFVDDEPQILIGLKHRLRKQRQKWEMLFAGSGEEALDLLERDPVDVLVADMRMPGMDGADLLKAAQAKHPEVVRIILSAYAELETVMRAVPVAHQYLSKPCDAGELENVVERACSLQQLVGDDRVRSIVGKIDRLPSIPKVYAQLVSALSNDDVTPRSIAAILGQDLAMTAKLLQIVNSAFFRLSRKISKVEEAVTYLGFNTVKQLVLAVEVFDGSDGKSDLSGLSLERLQKHSLFVAGIASAMFEEKNTKDDAYVAALLHDIGKLLLATALPSNLDEVTAMMQAENATMHHAEQALFGVTHAEIGAYLLGLWGLPYPIIEAVANHHHPERVDQQGFDILTAVYIADILAVERTEPVIRNATCESAEIDVAYLSRMGVADRLDGWRDIAAKTAEALGV